MSAQLDKTAATENNKTDPENTQQTPTITQDQIDPKTILPELGVIQPYMDDYFSNIRSQLGNDYIHRVMQLAASTETFTITLKKPDPNGRVEYDPATGKEEPVYDGTETVTRIRKKITPVEIDQIERARAEYVTCQDPKLVTSLMAKFYEIVAYKYLKITHDEYVRCYWEDTRMILDACTFRTVYSLPYAPKPSLT